MQEPQFAERNSEALLLRAQQELHQKASIVGQNTLKGRDPRLRLVPFWTLSIMWHHYVGDGHKWRDHQCFTDPPELLHVWWI